MIASKLDGITDPWIIAAAVLICGLALGRWAVGIYGWRFWEWPWKSWLRW